MAFTPDGYVWVATFEGVVRFDGARFAPMPYAWVTALGTRRVAALAVDRQDGALWMMVEERGLARWRDGELRAWSPEELGGVAKMLVEAPDRTWLITSRGVLRLDDAPVAEPWTVPVGAVAAFAPLPGGRALVASDEGVAWLATTDGGRRQLGPEDGVDDWVRTIEVGPDGQITAFIGETLRVWVGDRFVPDPEGAACTLRYTHVPRTCAPLGAPASAWRVTTGSITHEGRPVLPLHGPAEGPVADPRGDVWVPTSADGLLRLRRALVTNLAGASEDARVDRVFVDAADRLWARSAAKWSWRVFEPGARSPGANGRAVPEAPGWLFEVAPGTLVGVQRREGVRGRYHDGTLQLEPPRPAPVGPLLDALRIATGTLLAGDDGLAMLVDGLPVPTPTQGAVLTGARALVALDDGAVAVGTRSDGLFVVHNGVATAMGGQEGRMVQAIRHLRRDGEMLWAATEEAGLCAVVPSTPGWTDATWRCLRPADSARGVHASLPDGQGRTWLSTNSGLWVGRDEALAAFARGDGPPPALLRLGVEAGMARAEANGPYGAAVARDAAGVLWFPTQGGAVGVDPKRFTFPEAPRVHLDPPRVGERVADTLALERGQELTLTWSAPAAAWADQITYQTRLGDGPWTTREERSVTLARLPPGPFTFEVRAGLAGAWGPVASVSGVRVAAWDEGPLVWVGALALAVTGAAVAVRLRTRALRRRQAALEREVEARTAEVRAQAQASEARTATLAEQAARLAELEDLRTRAIVNLHHELRTPLTLVMGGVARLTRPDDAREAAAHELVLRNAARLEALLGQLGDVARLERGEIAPRTRRLEVTGTAATLVARFAGLATERGVTLVGPAPAPEPHVWVDPDIFDKILANLVHNALKFTPAGGRVDVGVHATGDHVRVEVRDTGVGVPAHARERVFERLYQVARGDDRPHEGSGIGLALARELTELSGGESDTPRILAAEPASGSRSRRVPRMCSPTRSRRTGQKRSWTTLSRAPRASRSCSSSRTTPTCAPGSSRSSARGGASRRPWTANTASPAHARSPRRSWSPT